MPRQDPIDRLLKPIDSFIHEESTAGLVLLASTAVAVVLANSPLREPYHHFWETVVGVRLGGAELEGTLHHIINDGLMAMFFFVVALELKREFVGGEFANPKNAVMAVAASMGGMALPALIYLAVNGWTSPTSVGWGIPIGTDTAFVLGLLGLLGTRVPAAAKVFFVTVAVVDDIGAVVVIALFYSSDISMGNLLVGGAFLVVLLALNAVGVRNVGVYGLLGIGGVWLAFLLSGVHATVAGVLGALAIPARTKLSEASYPERLRELADRFAATQIMPGLTISSEQLHLIRKVKRFSTYAETPLQRLEQGLHPWVAYVVLPLFALANAGIALPSSLEGLLQSRVTMGVLLGLVLGKPAGILGMSWLMARLGHGRLGQGVRWGHMIGVGMLSGVGFTMSVFISELAFPEDALRQEAKLGILFASLLAGSSGFLVLRLRRPTPQPAGEGD
jgi:NhaA family Na+:H+ antiporter